MYTNLNAAADIATRLIDDIETAEATGGDAPAQYVLNEIYGVDQWSEDDEAALLDTLGIIARGEASETDIAWMKPLEWLGTKAERKALTQ